MFECPVCQAPMEEIVVYVTECCKAVVEEDEDKCPVCGAEDPVLIEGEPTFLCENCGHEE